MITTLTLFILFNAHAPNFKAVNLEREKVELYKSFLSDTTKKATVLTFFATWCPSCFEEMDFLQEFHKTYKDSGLQVIAVNTEGLKTLPKVRSLIAGKKFDFPVLIDPKGTVTKLYKIQILPTAFLLDDKGEIIYSKTGFTAQDKKTLSEKTLGLLKKTVEEEKK